MIPGQAETNGPGKPVIGVIGSQKHFSAITVFGILPGRPFNQPDAEREQNGGQHAKNRLPARFCRL